MKSIVIFFNATFQSMKIALWNDVGELDGSAQQWHAGGVFQARMG
jgi:hypothetical protein